MPYYQVSRANGADPKTVHALNPADACSQYAEEFLTYNGVVLNVDELVDQGSYRVKFTQKIQYSATKVEEEI